MKKIIIFAVIIAIFAAIGLGVKRFVEGPAQPVDGILVSGIATDVEKAKQVFKEDIKKSLDYKVKYVTTTKEKQFSEKDKPEELKDEDKVDTSEYAVISNSTALKLFNKGILRARKDPLSVSSISEPVKDKNKISSNHNLYFSLSDWYVENNQVNLNGKMIPIKYVKQQIWIGYDPMDLVILKDQDYNTLSEPESIMRLIQFKNRNFDYKNKQEVEKVLKELDKTSPTSENKINFVEVQD
ncbi:hypothetical protein BN2127_JRS1_04502 [Bacillus cereus]|nr:hypothetical protein BN2127_JRS1_04502 [Bacillus cereus]